MIEQTARVLRVEDGIAWLQVERQSSCGQCSVQKGCGTGVLSKVLGNRFSELRALTRIDVSPGDMVTIAMHESTLLKSAFLMYLLPLFIMFAAAIAGSWLASLLALQNRQLMIVIFAFAGLFMSFVYIRRYMKRHAMNERFQPVIVRKNIGFNIKVS